MFSLPRRQGLVPAAPRSPHKPSQPAARALSLLLERHGAFPPNLVRTIWLHGQPCGPRGSQSVAPHLGAKRRRPVASALSPQSSLTAYTLRPPRPPERSLHLVRPARGGARGGGWRGACARRWRGLWPWRWWRAPPPMPST